MKRRTNRVGDAMIKQMREDGVYVVLSRDCVLGDVGRDLGLRLYRAMNPHPVNYMAVAADWLSRDDRFRTGRVHAHNAAGRGCILRSFRLKEEHR